MNEWTGAQACPARGAHASAHRIAAGPHAVRAQLNNCCRSTVNFRRLSFDRLSYETHKCYFQARGPEHTFVSALASVSANKGGPGPGAGGSSVTSHGFVRDVTRAVGFRPRRARASWERDRVRRIR